MNPNKKANQFYVIMAIVCAVMAVLVHATANENNFGGLPLQRMIVVVLSNNICGIYHPPGTSG